MVKASRVIDVEVGGAAELPYEQTSLAKRAPASRRRLAGILVVGAVALGVEAFVSSWLWGAVGLLLVFAAWRVSLGRLGALIGAGLAAALAAFLPLTFIWFLPPATSTTVALVVSFVLGVAASPDIILLMRDAELQNTYGKWAERGSLRE